MTDTTSTPERWARFRFAVVGPLLAAPPEGGKLHAALEALSRQAFMHPVTGQPVRFAYSTIERWFYAATRDADPVAQLRRRVRKDAGTSRTVSAGLAAAIRKQYAEHPRWSYQLHYDNIEALCETDDTLGSPPSYPTVRRYMKSQGFVRQKRRTDHRIESGPREVRSFEHPHAHGLWHLDFHHGKRNVLLPDGRWLTPKLLAVLDDHCRLCCHAQWYLEEGAEELIHGLSQAFMKRGLPRSLMMDNGPAMIAAETIQGLARLGIHVAFTQPESPYQNGKQETFFAPVEGRLIAMLEGVKELDLDLLNQATIAWVEGEYHKRYHESLEETPLERLAKSRSLARDCPSVAHLKDCFRQQVSRKQRRGDGTCSIDGVRFEIPSHYRHIERVQVRYARWDLSHVTLVDPVHGTALCPLYPVDKHRNADGYRALVEPARHIEEQSSGDIAPRLKQLMADFAATGLPPAYIPQIKDQNADE